MSYTLGQVRSWDTGALADASGAALAVESAVQESRRILADGAAELDEGWDGLSARAVLDAAEEENRHVTRLASGLEDLADALVRAEAALGPAVRAVRDRVYAALGAGLGVDSMSVSPAPGRDDVDQATVDAHAEAIGSAVDTVRSLDEHYGREIDEIAARLHGRIPTAVDRGPIPGPDDPWPGRGVDAMTGAMAEGNRALADELDPGTRGRHKLNPVPDDFGRAASTGLRGLGRFAGPIGGGLTAYDGVKAHAEGETSTVEAAFETTGAVGGGMLGGVAAGAAAGSFFGPAGTFIGAGVGAVVGTELGKGLGDWTHERLFGD